MARKPVKRGGARGPRNAPALEGDGAARSSPSPVLIVMFLVLAVLGAVIGWLATGDFEAAIPSVSLSLDQPTGERVEELMAAPKPAAAIATLPKVNAAPSAPISRRTLPVTVAPDGKISLAPAPDPALVEQTTIGPLPRIAEDGAQAWHVYAHPAPANDGRPRIAIVITSMGLREAPTRLAVQKLPAPVSLAFTPYGDGVQEWISQARAAGHEVLLELPMEPYGYPENDPGPQALLTSLSPEENTNRLQWLLSRFPGYVGVINFFGGKFSASEMALRPVMVELKGRGLMIVDNQSASRSKISTIAGQINMPFVSTTMQLDADLTLTGIDAALGALERKAVSENFAAAIGSPLPLTIERISLWAEKLQERGIILVPVTALIPGTGK